MEYCCKSLPDPWRRERFEPRAFAVARDQGSTTAGTRFQRPGEDRVCVGLAAGISRTRPNRRGEAG